MGYAGSWTMLCAHRYTSPSAYLSVSLVSVPLRSWISVTYYLKTEPDINVTFALQDASHMLVYSHFIVHSVSKSGYVLTVGRCYSTVQRYLL